MKLPASAQEIADVIGREQALLLIGKLPRSYRSDGRGSKVNLYVPTLARLGADHPHVRILGWHDAVKLSKAFGGEIMYPASCAFIYRAFRDQNILRLARLGVRLALIAKHMDVSERHVRNLVQENPPEDAREAANDNAPILTKARA